MVTRQAARGDVRRAAALLDAAGWRSGPDGTRRKAGAALALAMTIPSGFVAIEATAVQVQATWKSLGIDVTLRPMLSNQLLAPVTGTLSRGDFEVDLEGDGYANVPRSYELDHDGGRAAARPQLRTDRARDQSAPVVPLVWLRRPTVWDASLAGMPRNRQLRFLERLRVALAIMMPARQPVSACPLQIRRCNKVSERHCRADHESGMSR